MKKIYVLISFHCLILIAHCQNDPAGNIRTGTFMGAYSARFIDPLAGTWNLAGTAGESALQMEAISVKPYWVKELRQYLLQAIIPFSGTTIGVSLQHIGSNGYTYTNASLGCAKSLGKLMSAGIQFRLHYLSLTGYGRAAVPDATVSFCFHLSDKVHAGFSADQPFRTHFGQQKDYIQREYAAGFGYECSDKVLISTEFVSLENTPPIFRVGIKYKPTAAFFAAAGLNTNNISPSLTAGLAWRSFRLIIMASYHPSLGLSTGLGIGLQKTKIDE